MAQTDLVRAISALSARRILFFGTLVLLAQGNACSQSHNADSNILDSIGVAVGDGTYANLDGVVISRHGSIVFEQYYHGFSADSLHDTRSSFKSVTGLLIGIAIDKGFIKDVNEKVYGFFPEYAPYGNWDARKDSMTVGHLLEMKSGFDCEEWDGTKDCEDEMSMTEDWIKFCLDLPLSDKPGGTWNYTSINTMLLGGIIAHASGMTVTEFAEKFLFVPLGIESYNWTRDPVGHEMTAGSFYIRPRDMAKIGELVLNEGVYNGTRIVSAAWIHDMATKRTEIEDFSNVGIAGSEAATPQPTYYGYSWYNEEIKTPDFTHNILFASGNGGQYIMIVKDLDLVVVFTGNSYNSRRSKLPFDTMIRYILPYFDRG